MVNKTRRTVRKKTASKQNSYWDLAKSTFEQGLEEVKRVTQDNGKKSKEKLMKNFEDLIDNLGAIELKEHALKKTNLLRRELKKKSRKIVKDIKNMDLQFMDSEMIEQAKDKVMTTKDQVFNMLDIPTQKDIHSLTRKVASLEKKIKTISNRKRTGR